MISTRALLHCLVVAIAALPLVGTLSGQFSETFVGAISNSASYAVSGENGYGIARGSLFVVFGENLGPNQLQYAQTFPLPKALAGTSVQITMGATSYDAIMIYSLAGQIAAILPSSVPAGSGSLTVTYNNQSSPPAPITVVQSAFGTYTLSSNGIGAGIVTRPNYQVASFENPVNPGDILIIWGTGLGPVAGNEAAGPLPGNQFPGTEVFAGNQSASVQYAGRSGCCAGLDQIVFQVPSTVPLGCFVPIAVRSGGVVSNFTTIPIATPSHNCSDSVGFPSNLVTKAQAGQTVTVGLAGIARYRSCKAQDSRSCRASRTDSRSCSMRRCRSGKSGASSRPTDHRGLGVTVQVPQSIFLDKSRGIGYRRVDECESGSPDKATRGSGE